METLEFCPVCKNNNIVVFLGCKDHFFTNENFNICKCNECGFLFTNPRPPSQELGRYYKSENYISHSNSQKGIINRIYHIIRKRNHKKKYNIINREIANGKILDIGCATGEFLHFFQKKGWDVNGIEPDPDARKFACESYKMKVSSESELDNFENEIFDVITMWHVLEHVSDLNRRMSDIVRLLKTNGLIVIAIPNAGSYDAQHYGSFWAGYDVPRHLYHFTPEVALKLFCRYSLKCIKIVPMKFDSFYVSLLSEKYLSKQKKYLKAFFIGLKSNCRGRKNNNYSSLIFLLKKEKC
jgi:2-polyprenyl-3-methyl-5-hydroxy-6-metoxy-1,4-benzoquinol methylase